MRRTADTRPAASAGRTAWRASNSISRPRRSATADVGSAAARLGHGRSAHLRRSRAGDLGDEFNGLGHLVAGEATLGVLNDVLPDYLAAVGEVNDRVDAAAPLGVLETQHHDVDDVGMRD